jgi:single-strand DNA-binding protein
MSGVNQINLVGNAGRDAEMTYTSTGKAVAKFSLAVSEYSGRDASGAAQYTTQWFNVITWNGLAESVNKLVSKGNTFFVSGRLVVRQFDMKNGGKGVSVDVIANAVTPVGKKAEAHDNLSTSDDTEELDNI